ncbi:MAG: hypothetical protein QM689_04435 [Oscillospiraceae bacterium]
MRKTTQQEIDSLVQIFRDAQEQLMNTIINSGGVGTKVYANTILKQLERQLKRMEKKSAFFVQSVVPKEYQSALDEIYAYFKKNNLLMNAPQAFAQVHEDAIYALAREMQFHIGQGLDSAGRRVMRYVNDARDDVLRQQGLQAAAQKAASGATIQQMQQNLAERLKNEGIFAVQYGSGKGAYQVGIDSYAEMVARSTTREAGNLARENQLTENGYDLVVMTEHYPTCAVCAMYQGRVYSISGKDKRFPSLYATAFRSGYRNVHPNCRHSVHAWIEELADPDEVAAAVQKGAEPFADKRTEDEKGLYNKQQADNRRMREDRYQYERYKMRLGDDAPKSYQAFKRVKKAGGDDWAELQKMYRAQAPISPRAPVPAEVELPAVEGAGDMPSAEKIVEKPVDKASESDIMNIGSDGVAFENQRYGRNKDTIVNRTYIESGEYRRKFDTISTNPELNKSLYDKSKQALKHRSGTEFEDMYWFDEATGKVIASETNSTEKRKIVYSEKTKRAVSSTENVLSLHTHPSSMPPSAADFNSCFRNKYKMGYIACHNGKLYGYASEQEISEDLYNLYIASFVSDGYDDLDAQFNAIEKLKENHLIKFWEVL